MRRGLALKSAESSAPGAYLIVRFGIVEPKSWRELHRDQLFVNGEGKVLECPSLASESF